MGKGQSVAEYLLLIGGAVLFAVILIGMFSIFFPEGEKKPSAKEIFCPEFIKVGSIMVPEYFCPDENDVGRQFKCRGSKCFWLEESQEKVKDNE